MKSSELNKFLIVPVHDKNYQGEQSLVTQVLRNSEVKSLVQGKLLKSLSGEAIF